MTELIINQFTKDADLQELEGKQITSIFTQSVYSSSSLTPFPGTLVLNVTRPIETGASILFDNGFEYFVENGKVFYT